MNALANSLNRLLKNNGCLMASDFTPKQKQELEDFSRDTRLISISKQGRSTIYKIENSALIVDYLRKTQPSILEQLDSSLPERSKNIANDRASKKGKSTHESCYLLMKAWDESVIWQAGKNLMIPAKHTKCFGVSALTVTTKSQWQCNTPLWLVENQALFDRVDWLPDDFQGCIAYYAGYIPNILIQWFAEQRRCPEIVMFPDYDGVGLANYVRLLSALHSESKLRFYWIPNWEAKLQKFGNADLWRKTRSQFERAIEQLKSANGLNEEFEKLAQLSQYYGLALEQEAIWLKV